MINSKQKLKSTVKFIALTLIIIPAAMLFYRHFSCGENFVWIRWSSRDLIRAQNLFRDFPFSGAEISFGSGLRTPGGAYYYLLSLPFIFTDNPAVHYVFMNGLFAVSAILLFNLLHRNHSLTAAAAGCAVYIASAFITETITSCWNPGFTPLFIVLVYYFAVTAVREQKPELLKWSFASAAVGAQMHASLLLLLPALCFALRQSGAKKQLLRPALLCAVFFITPYLPYIINELANGFPNSMLWNDQNCIVQNSRLLTRTMQAINFLLYNLGGFGLKKYPVSYILPVMGLIWPVYLSVTGKQADRQNKDSGIIVFVAIVFAAFTGFLILAPIQLPFNAIKESRYLASMVPGLSLLCAGAVTELERRLNKKYRIYAIILYLFTALSAASQMIAVVRQTKPPVNIPDLYKTTLEMMPEYKENLSGRVFAPENISHYILYKTLSRGHAQNGSQYGTGLIICPDDSQETDPVKTAEKYLNRKLPQLEIIQTKQEHRHLFIKYTGPERLFSSIYSRYLLTPPEKLTYKLMDSIPTNTAQEIADKTPGKTAWFVNLEDSIFILIEAKTIKTNTVFTLHSNQLRGKACNTKFFRDSFIYAPTIVFTDIISNEKIIAPFASGPVGANEVITPLTIELKELQAGHTYKIRFETYAEKGVPANKLPLYPNTKRSIEIGRITIP